MVSADLRRLGDRVMKELAASAKKCPQLGQKENKTSLEIAQGTTSS